MEGVVGVEDGGEEAEGKRADAERHVEACVAQTLEHPASASALRLCPLSLRPRGRFQPGVFLAGAASAVQRNDFVSADAGFTHGTLLSARPRLQPLMKAGPTEQVSAHTDDRVSGRVQANVTLERGPISLRGAPAAPSRSSALPGRYSSDSGRRHGNKYEKSV